MISFPRSVAILDDGLGLSYGVVLLICAIFRLDTFSCESRSRTCPDVSSLNVG